MITYRNEIDGLRAISVIAVILYHAGHIIPGGFVGVDVFFAISGFLITSILINEFKNDKFKLRKFWARRIRRILPLATFVSLITLLLGYLILDNESLKHLSLSSIYQSFFSANFYFISRGDYFAPNSEFQPLLHMWSLSLEEQFYFFYPFLLLLFLRYFKNLKILLFLITLFSFVVGIYLVNNSPGVAFYLLPGRAWELSAGGLIALIFYEKKINHLANFIDLAGIGLIVIPTLILNKNSIFPGYNALMPVLGTCLILIPKARGSILKNFLSTKPLVYLGKISFSLYLWHWPIWVFANSTFIDLTMLNLICYLVLIFILSSLTWHCVEEPFRRLKFFKANNITYLFGALLISTIYISSLFIYKSDGFISNSTEYDKTLSNDINYVGLKYESRYDFYGVDIGNTKKKGNYDFVLWGDSHGMVHAEIISKLANQNGLLGKAFLKGGFPPMINVWKPFHQKRFPKKETVEINLKRLNWIIDSDVKKVILICRWQGYVWGVNDNEVNDGNPYGGMASMITDKPIKSINDIDSLSSFKRQYKSTIEALLKHDKEVWVLIQTPVASKISPARDFYKYKKFPSFNESYKNTDTLKKLDYLNSRKIISDVITNIDHESYNVLDPANLFFDKDENLILSEDRAYYRDEDHLSPYGSIAMGSLFQLIFN